MPSTTRNEMGPGAGALSLPVTKVRGNLLRSDTSPGTPAARILVIEDDVEMAAAVAACLANSGFLPQPCFHGTQGLQLALSGHFDVITLDRMLPGCDGLEIAK